MKQNDLTTTPLYSAWLAVLEAGPSGSQERELATLIDAALPADPSTEFGEKELWNLARLTLQVFNTLLVTRLKNLGPPDDLCRVSMALSQSSRELPGGQVLELLRYQLCSMLLDTEALTLPQMFPTLFGTAANISLSDPTSNGK